MSSVATAAPSSDGPEWGPSVRPIPYARFQAEILELYKPPLRAKATFSRVRQTLELVGRLVGPDGKTDALTPILIAQFIASRPPGQSNYTLDALLRTLRTACNYAVSQGYLRANPFAFRKKWVRTPQPQKQRHHSLEDIARVLDQGRQEIARKPAGSWAQWRARRLYALAATVAYTGLRKKEALFLRVEDIDLERRILLILPRTDNHLKTDASAQPVPIPDALASILADWLPHLAIPESMGPVADESSPMPESNPKGIRDPGWVFPNAYRTGPWTGGSPGNRPIDRLKSLGARAGVKGFHFLSLRHSYATHAESAWGFSEAMIQRILRHTNRRTQQHYRHADVTNLRGAVKSLGFGNEPELPAPPASEPPASIAEKLTEHSWTPVPPKPVAKVPGPKAVPKLDLADAIEMRRLREGGFSYKDLMKRFGVSKSTVHYTLYGVIHKDDGTNEC